MPAQYFIIAMLPKDVKNPPKNKNKCKEEVKIFTVIHLFVVVDPYEQHIDTCLNVSSSSLLAAMDLC